MILTFLFIYLISQFIYRKDRILKAAAMAQYLTGTVTFAKDELGKKACSYQVRYILPETTKNSSSSKTSVQSENNSKETKDVTGTNVNGTNNANAVNGTNGDSSTSSSSTSTSASKEKESKDRSKMKVDDYNEALLDFKISTLEKLGKN